MSYEVLESPVELTDAELDVIAGGQPEAPRNVAVRNLVNVQANLEDINVTAPISVLSRVQQDIENL
jgi:hypothetical protein